MDSPSPSRPAPESGLPSAPLVSAEVAELVRALEQQYDTAENNGADGSPESGSGLLGEGESMPTADELAAQFERFLAENQGRIDPPGPRTTEGPDT